MDVSVAVAAETGQARPRAEDFYCVEPKLGLFAIAESAGTASGLASRTLIRALRQFIVERASESMEPEPATHDASLSPLGTRLLQGLKTAFHAIADGGIWERSETGTDVCALLVGNDRVAIGRKGRCGAYRLCQAESETAFNAVDTTAPESSTTPVVRELTADEDDHWLLSTGGLPASLTPADSARLLASTRAGHFTRQRAVVEITVPGSGSTRTVVVLGAAAV